MSLELSPTSIPTTFLTQMNFSASLSLILPMHNTVEKKITFILLKLTVRIKGDDMFAWCPGLVNAP